MRLKAFRFFILLVTMSSLIQGCYSHPNKMNFIYQAKIVTGEYLTLNFNIYFKSKESLEFAETRKENLTHALNLIFPAYPYSKIDESRLPTLLEKACNQVFYKSVKLVKIQSVEFER